MTDVSKSTIQRCQQGSAAAFAEIVARFERPLFGYVVRLGCTPPGRDPEDVVQEIFVKAYQHIQSYQGRDETAFSTWLFAIVLLALILSVAFNLRSSAPISRVTPVAIDHTPTAQPLLQPVNATTTVAPGLPGSWTVPAMAPGTYVIILGTPPMVANDAFIVAQKPKPNHAL